MRCIRCHAEDTDDAKFCRACGFPVAMNDFVACAVCGGEVHLDVRVCPGCRNQFPLPVPLPQVALRQKRTLRLPGIAAVAIGIASGYVAHSVTRIDLADVAAVEQPADTPVKATFDSPAPVTEAENELITALKVSSVAVPAETSKPRKVHVIYLDLSDRPEVKKRKPKFAKAKQASAKPKKLIVAAAKQADSPPSAEPMEAERVALAVAEKFTPKSSNYFGREIERWHFCQGKWNTIPDCPHYPDHKPKW